MNAPGPGAASSAWDEAAEVISEAMLSRSWGHSESSEPRTIAAALIARPDVLAALAAEAGLVVLDPNSDVDASRLSGAVWKSGIGSLSPVAAEVALNRLAGECTR